MFMQCERVHTATFILYSQFDKSLNVNTIPGPAEVK